MIALTFALPAESQEFLRHLSQKSRTDRRGLKTIRGRINERLVEVVHTGVGEKICRLRLEKFLQDQKFDFLISAGFAGAIDDNLQIGDLLFARNLSTIDLNEKSSLLSSLPIHAADLLTVRALIDSVNERMTIARTSRAAAVDMETEHIAQACATRALPFLSLRVISDTPRNGLPAPANVLFDIEQQRTDLLKLAGHFLARPNHIPRLAQFAKRIRGARKILATALTRVVREL
jgi:adenosylhomocysteine nucleosidase